MSLLEPFHGECNVSLPSTKNEASEVSFATVWYSQQLELKSYLTTLYTFGFKVGGSAGGDNTNQNNVGASRRAPA